MVPMLAVFGLSGGELILVLTAVLILFGAKKIPDFAKGLGQGIKEFKKASREVQEEIERAGEELEALPPPSPRLPAEAKTPEATVPASTAEATAPASDAEATVPASTADGNPPSTDPSKPDPLASPPYS